MEQSVSSISNSISKDMLDEEMSLFRASMEDAASRLKDGIEPETISNESIGKGDVILETYQVTSDAIHGGMGSVWRVHHMGWDVDLAMKRPQPKFFAEGSSRRKAEFIAECENWINLGLHPGIVSCYYVRDTGGVPSVFSEWMKRGSLKDRISDGLLYKCSEEALQERVLNIAIQTAGGLQYSHENGLLHQDIKPGNILLTRKWDAKIADFGLARSMSPSENDRGPAGTGGYTPAYCPAEQTKGEKPARWMDIYAWALTVLEMYAEERLWETGAEAAAHVGEYLPKCRHKIPDGMQTLLQICLTEKTDSLDKILREMKSVYARLFGRPYTANIPNVKMLAAESLNNKAVSMIDLGKPELAEKIWAEALSVQPDHAVSVFNQTMYLWSQGRLTDTGAISRIHSTSYSSDSMTKELREEMRDIQTPLQFYQGLSAGKQDIRTKQRHSLWDADFDIYGNIWIASKNRALRKVDGTTGEILLTEILSDLEITNVACDGSGRFVYYAERRDDGYERYEIWRVDTENDFEKKHLTKIPAHYLKVFCVDDEKGQLICTFNDFTVNPYTDEKIWDYCMTAVDLTTFEKTPVPYTHEQYKKDSKASLQAASVSGWCIRQEEKTLTLSHPDFPSPFVLEGRILQAVSRDGQSLFASSTRFVEDGMDRTWFCYIYHLPRYNRLSYRLNQIKDILAMAELEMRSAAEKSKFQAAMKQKDFREAIAAFEAYREQEGKRDALSTVEMEAELARHCRRTRVHHLLDLENDRPSGMKEPAEYWNLENLVPFSSRKVIDKKHRDLYKALDDRTWKKLLAFAKYIAKKKEQCHIVEVREDLSQIILMTEPADEGQRNRKDVFHLYLYDPEEDVIRPCGVTGGYYNLFSPDGNAWVHRANNTNLAGRGVPVLYLRGLTSGVRLSGSNAYSSMTYEYSFSPDSRFLACRIHQTYGESDQLLILPVDKAKEPFSMDLPEGCSSLRFSADGSYLSRWGHTFRISYHYEAPNPSGWDSDAEWFIRYWTRKNPSLPEDPAAMDDLMEQLRCCGYGFLERERVAESVRQHRRAIEEIDRRKNKFQLFPNRMPMIGR